MPDIKADPGDINISPGDIPDDVRSHLVHSSSNPGSRPRGWYLSASSMLEMLTLGCWHGVKKGCCLYSVCLEVLWKV